MKITNVLHPVIYGVLATSILLFIYGAILTLVSGWSYMLEQLNDFWPYILTLSIGFGIQITLYFVLRAIVHKNNAGTVAAVSGTTSTLAMVSCCTHYLVNVLPVLGATGAVVFIAQYQIELFWVGIASNIAGIAYMLYKIKTAL